MYKFNESKKRVNEILNSKTKIKTEDHVPATDSDYTYDNGIKAYVASIFVDIVDSSPLFSDDKQSEKVARIIRAFTQEIIHIIRDCSHYRQIGIRGDCVYGVFDGGSKGKIKEVFYTAEKINTFISLFNKQLGQQHYDTISVGIGVALGHDLIIKAGQSRSGVNDRVWIGDAVVKAAKLSDIANRPASNFNGPIMITEWLYDNIIEELTNDDVRYKDWLKSVIVEGENFYHCNTYFTEIDIL